jgi:hypothetical protein
VRALHLTLPYLAVQDRHDLYTIPWLDENELERYLDNAHWLEMIMNGSTDLERVYINIGMSCKTAILDLPPDAVFDTKERRRRF